jgi:HAD superfamily hydrolase (TIGR01509 family)
MITFRTHWVFDLDNTLADSAIDFDAMRRELGLPLGKPILEEIDARPATEAAALHRRLAEIERGFALRATPLPGVHKLLSTLIERGAQLGILTRNSRANALETLEVCDLTEYFDPDHVLGRDEAAPKPHPEGILKLLAAWNATPETAVMVGDFHYDLEAGRRAEVTTIYYDAAGQDLWTAEADLRVQSHAALLDLIQRKNP